VIFTPDAVYIGVWAFDSNPSGIVAKRMERDFGSGTEDAFGVVIDPFNDDRNGYLFIINPNGAKADGLVADNGSKYNSAWDGVWEVRTTVNNAGWFAEIRIPFSTLRTPETEVQSWGFNASRVIPQKREVVLWQGWSRNSKIEQVSAAGTVTGIKPGKTGTFVDVRPYSLFGVEFHNPNSEKTIGKIGVDANYLLTPTVRLSVTVNPDFAQVENDQIQINLTRFSLYYPEKRKFFLEGQEFYDFKMGYDNEPYYSRRIGLSDAGREIPIIAGARVLGKAGGTMFGAMSMQTAEAEGASTANYTAVRVKQDVFDQSYIGFLGINKYQDGEANSTYAADFKYSISDLFGDKNFGLGILIAQTYTSDAEAKHGGAQRIYMEYPNDLVYWYAVGSRVARDFNPEAGFLRRTNFQTYYTNLELSPRPTEYFPFIRRLSLKPIELDYYCNDITGQLENLTYTFQPLGIAFESGEYISFYYQRYGELIPERFEIHKDAFIDAATYWYSQYSVYGETYFGRPLSAWCEFSAGELFDGAATAVNASVIWSASKHLSISTDYVRREFDVDTQTVLKQTIGLRMSVAASPELLGAFYGQWDHDREELLLNYRFNWIPNPGSDFYLVINQRIANNNGTLLLKDTTILSKIVWRFEV